MIIGLTGKKRSGKTSVATILQKNHPGVFVEVGQADPIKDAAALWFDLEHPMPDEKREVIDERWGLSPRQIWQLLGTEVGRAIHPEVWLRLGLRHAAALLEDRVRTVRQEETASFGTTRTSSYMIDHPSVVIITDVRFDNEARAIRDTGGAIWRISRETGLAEDSHASETGVDVELADVFIDNHGRSLDELEIAVEEAWEQTKMFIRNKS